jgi:nicotinamidase/pyrazinamidase
MSIAAVNVDVQGAFNDEGSLGGPRRSKVIAPIIKLSKDEAIDRVYSSRDNHPANHSSFIEQGGIWPIHAVQGTPEAEIVPEVLAVTDEVINKGEHPDVEEYSAASEGTGLIESLREHGIQTTVVTGWCTDYCVKGTAIELAQAGFAVVVPLDCIQGVDVNVGDSERAIAEMEAAGVEIAQTWEHAVELAEGIQAGRGHSL